MSPQTNNFDIQQCHRLLFFFPSHLSYIYIYVSIQITLNSYDIHHFMKQLCLFMRLGWKILISYIFRAGFNLSNMAYHYLKTLFEKLCCCCCIFKCKLFMKSYSCVSNFNFFQFIFFFKMNFLGMNVCNLSVIKVYLYRPS